MITTQCEEVLAKAYMNTSKRRTLSLAKLALRDAPITLNQFKQIIPLDKLTYPDRPIKSAGMQLSQQLLLLLRGNGYQEASGGLGIVDKVFGEDGHF